MLILKNVVALIRSSIVNVKVGVYVYGEDLGYGPSAFRLFTICAISLLWMINRIDQGSTDFPRCQGNKISNVLESSSLMPCFILWAVNTYAKSHCLPNPGLGASEVLHHGEFKDGTMNYITIRRNIINFKKVSK